MKKKKNKEFKNKKIKKQNKTNIFNTTQKLHKGRELVINAFRSGFFQLKSSTGTERKILTSKQIIQRLKIALAQVKVGTNSKSVLNEIREIVYSLYQSREITKKYKIT